jgi:hypothetical protein
MLSRIQVRYLTCAFGVALVAAITALLGRNPLQIMLAPAGGIALGILIALVITQTKKLPVTATLGDL